ncbi:hypothetical protein MCOR25_004280 [Pyricularia grisea]|nr:hypothetical protein MCOR25_004280 [Pyricularia grisea]
MEQPDSDLSTADEAQPQRQRRQRNLEASRTRIQVRRGTHRPLPNSGTFPPDTDDEGEIFFNPAQTESQGQYRAYCIAKARCRLCQIAVQDGDLLVAYLGYGITSPWFTFVNNGDCHDDDRKITLHMTLADHPFGHPYINKILQPLPAICFHLDCHQARGPWNHEQGPFLAATRYVFRPSLSEERRRLEYYRSKLVKGLQSSLGGHGQHRQFLELPLEICLNIASFLDRHFAMVASTFAWKQTSDTTVNLALPLYASYFKMDGRHYIRELRNKSDEVAGGKANERLVVPPIRGDPNDSNHGDILIAVDHLGVRQIFFVPPGQRSNWQKKHPEVPGAWWMHIARPTRDTYWSSRTDGLKVRKLKPPRDIERDRMPVVYWKDPVIQIPSMINLPSRQTWPSENSPPSIIHMRHYDLNLPNTLGLCVAVRRVNDRLNCILEGIVSHRERPGNSSLDDLDVAFMDNLSISNPYYWIYMPMNRGERVSEMWVRYKLVPMDPSIDAETTWGWEEIFRGVVLFTNHGRSRVFGTFGDEENIRWRRIAYMHPNLPCRIYFEQRSLKQQNRKFKYLDDFPMFGRDQLLFAIGGDNIDGMAPVMVAEDDSNPPPMPSRPSISPSRDNSLLDSFVWQWLYTSCSLENIVELQLCIDRRTATSPAPVVMGMVVCYADGGRACVGQFRPDWVQLPTLHVSSRDTLHFYQKRVVGESLGRISCITNAPPSEVGVGEGEELITLSQHGTLEWWFRKDRNFLVHDHTIFETETGGMGLA